MPIQVSEKEAARLQALHEQAIVGSPSEPAFDDLTYLAAEICGTPIALIAFVDQERQWFKARVGVAIEEIPRDRLFSSGVLCPQDILVIPDVLADPRHAEDPAVGEPFRARFYAGVPLITAEDHVLGALSVIDHAPRRLEEWQRGALRILGRLVVRELEARQARRRSDRRRMEQIGTLAGGLAHEFSLLLSALAASDHPSGSEQDDGDPSGERQRRLLASARRAADLTRQILVFSRHRSLVPEILDLNRLIERDSEAWRVSAGAGIEIDLRLAADLGSVKADRAKIASALRHLVDHAREAMPRGGTLRVVTENVDIDATGHRAGDPPPPGRYVAVSVTGTGGGSLWSAGETRSLPRAAPDSGDGGEAAGLPAVHGIVAQSGGHLQVTAAPGGGASRRMLLPRLTDAGP